MPDKKKEQASAVGTHCNLVLSTWFYIIDIVGFCLTVSLIATSVCLFPLWKTYWIWKVSVYADYKAAYRISLIRSVVITSISSVVLELTATWYSWQKKCPSNRVRTHCMSVFFFVFVIKTFFSKKICIYKLCFCPCCLSISCKGKALVLKKCNGKFLQYFSGNYSSQFYCKITCFHRRQNCFNLSILQICFTRPP